MATNERPSIRTQTGWSAPNVSAERARQGGTGHNVHYVFNLIVVVITFLITYIVFLRETVHGKSPTEIFSKCR
jgi:hypothetical protein